MKKRLLIILGAGSSTPLGMPSVACLNQLMKQWAKEWAKSNGPQDHFGKLWQSADAYYLNGNSGIRPVLNFEKVLGDMVALAHWMEPAPWGDTLRQTTCDGATPAGMTFRYQQSERGVTEELAGDLEESLTGELDVIGEPEGEAVPPLGTFKGAYGASIELMDELSCLLETLARYVRDECRRVDLASAPGRKYCALLTGLRERFDIGVYNLNYDTAALGALPGAYTGFDKTGTFEPRVVWGRDDWDFIYHLHGSIHHSLDHSGGDEIVWRSNLDGDFIDGPKGRWSDKRSDRIKLPRTSLVAGGFKLDQLLVEPFQSFQASLVRHVYTADAILIGGYGFGDAHINFALHNRLSHCQDRPPVMVLDYAQGRVVPMRCRGDSWAMEFGQALCTGTGGHFFVDGPVGIELDPQDRVAVWQGGFIEAECRFPNIVQWLDSVLVPDSAQ